jgi:hypothetical protein
MSNRKLKIDRLPLGFTNLGELLAGTSGNQFIIASDVIAFFNSKITDYNNNLINNAPAALDSLGEIAAKLSQMGAADSNIEQMIATIIGTKANVTYVDGQLSLKANVADVYTKTEVDLIASDLVGQTQLSSEIQTIGGSIQSLTSEMTTLQDTVATGLADLSTAIGSKTDSGQVQAIAQGIANALENKILGGVGTDTDTLAELRAYVEQLQNLSEADVNGVMTAVSAKLDRSVFESLFTFANGKWSLSIDGLNLTHLLSGGSSLLTPEAFAGLADDSPYKVLIGNANDGSVKSMLVWDLMNFLAENPSSYVRERIDYKLDKNFTALNSEPLDADGITNFILEENFLTVPLYHLENGDNHYTTLGHISESLSRINEGFMLIDSAVDTLIGVSANNLQYYRVWFKNTVVASSALLNKVVIGNKNLVENHNTHSYLKTIQRQVTNLKTQPIEVCVEISNGTETIFTLQPQETADFYLVGTTWHKKRNAFDMIVSYEQRLAVVEGIINDMTTNS